MNKKLLALAVAAAVTPLAALADGSTVTLTGVVNGSLGFTKVDNPNNTGGTASGIQSNATRWSIDGSEDLGDGLKAIFSLAVDQRFSGPNGPGGDPAGPGAAGGLFNRNSYIGLAGGWGSLKMGQNEHQYEIQQILQDPLPASENVGNALNVMTRWGIAGMPNGFTRRDGNSIWYSTPNLSGFQGDIAYITNGNNYGVANGDKPSGWNLAGSYAIPGVGLTVYAAYASYKADDGFKLEDKAWRLGAGYTIADLTLNIAYEKLKANNVQTSNGQQDLSAGHWYLSADYRIGPGAIKFIYQKAKSASGGACGTNVNGAGVLDCNNSGAREYSLYYWHDLSKRTSAYIGYAKVNNDTGASFGGPADSTGTLLTGGKLTYYGLGLRTTF